MPHSYCSAPLKDESRLRTIGRATLARSKQPLVTGFLENVCGSKKLERFLRDDPTADERLEALKDTVGIPKPPTPYKYGQYRAEINYRLGYTGNSYAAHVRLRVPLEPLYIVMVKETVSSHTHVPPKLYTTLLLPTSRINAYVSCVRSDNTDSIAGR